MQTESRNTSSTTQTECRILARRLAIKMDVEALFKDPAAAKRGDASYCDMGTTCTDSNGEEDSG